MPHPGHPVSSTHVLTAFAGEHLLAFPSAATAHLASCPCSPPPPGAAPWLGGVAVWQEQVLWVLDPVGLSRSDPCQATAGARDRLVVVVDSRVESGDGHGGWGVLISTPAGLAQATPIAGELMTTCPAPWLRPCLLHHGRRAWLVDTVAIAADLQRAAAA